jgi:HECT-like Ubiquitin-conjugating enzyme (E2)-binding
VTYARPGLLLVGQTFALVHTDDCAAGAITAISIEHTATTSTATATAAGAKHDHHKCNGHTYSTTTATTANESTAAATTNAAAAVAAAASTYANVCCGRCDTPLGVSMATAKPADTSVNTSVDTASQQHATTAAATTALATGEYTLFTYVTASVTGYYCC